MRDSSFRAPIAYAIKYLMGWAVIRLVLALVIELPPAVKAGRRA